MTNTGTLQVTTPSNRKVAMTRSMLSEMVVALFQAQCESGSTRSVAMLRHSAGSLNNGSGWKDAHEPRG